MKAELYITEEEIIKKLKELGINLDKNTINVVKNYLVFIAMLYAQDELNQLDKEKVEELFLND